MAWRCRLLPLLTHFTVSRRTERTSFIAVAGPSHRWWARSVPRRRRCRWIARGWLAPALSRRPGPLTRGQTFWFMSELVVWRWLNPMLFRRWPGPRLGRRVFGQAGCLLVSR